MSLKDYPKILLEAIAIWELMRRMGFPSDDIYFGTEHAGGRGMIGIRVEAHQGEKRFPIRVGITKLSVKKAERKWKALANEWNADSTPEEDRRSIYQNSIAWNRGPEMLIKFTLAGFKPPNRNPILH
jgi:hypothetical protein